MSFAWRWKVLYREGLYINLENTTKYKLLEEITKDHAKYLLYMTESSTKNWKCVRILGEWVMHIRI
jgi:hypothetical protein